MPAPAEVTATCRSRQPPAARNGAGGARADDVARQRRCRRSGCYHHLTVSGPDAHGRGFRRGGARRRGHSLAARFRTHRGGHVQPGRDAARRAAKPDGRRLPHPGAAVPRAGGGAPGARRGPGRAQPGVPVRSARAAAGAGRRSCSSARPIREHWPGLRPIGARTDRLRQVIERPKPRPAGACRPATRVVGYGFFTGRRDAAGGDRQRSAARWPALHFVLQPRPAD